ncbi:hypothetical protein diail_10727, partial [Diaporthe ilicicola]
MASSVYLIVVSTAVCMICAIWWWTSCPTVTTSSLGISLVEFGDGDESKTRYASDTGKLLREGYDRYLKNGKPFYMRNHADPSRPFVFLPVQYMEEVRNAPQDKLSLPLYTEKASILNHVNGPAITEEVQHAARLNLNRALNNLVGPIQDQCFLAANEKMPECPEWTPIHIYPVILQLFAHMSARVMVGPELCKGWPAISLQYLNAALKAPGVVRQKYHPRLYWSAKYFSPEVKDVMKVRQRAAEFVRPVLEARQAALRRVESEQRASTSENHDDFIQWLMDEHRARGKEVTPDELVQNIFITMVASMHGTSSIGYSVLLDLLAHPGALADIKEEINRIKRDELQGQQVWSRHALGELRLLDSFMRETHRTHPFTEATMQRTVVVPYTFKDGLTLPAGISVNFTSLQHSMDKDVHGADADTFDPRRWANKRQHFDTSKFQFASTSDDWFNWGGGPHACPGRFLADVTIKLILIYLLTNYDIKYPDGITARPTDGRRNLMITPDMTTPILFKKLS